MKIHLNNLAFCFFLVCSAGAKATLLTGLDLYSEPLELQLLSGETENAKIEAYSALLGYGYRAYSGDSNRISLVSELALGAGIIKNAQDIPSNTIESSYTFHARPRVSLEWENSFIGGFENDSMFFWGLTGSVAVRLQNLGRVSGGEYSENFYRTLLSTGFKIGTQIQTSTYWVFCYEFHQGNLRHNSFSTKLAFDF
jgi:hypothetical protein